MNLNERFFGYHGEGFVYSSGLKGPILCLVEKVVGKKKSHRSKSNAKTVRYKGHRMKANENVL